MEPLKREPFSIVIPTVGREGVLWDTVSALAWQMGPEDELRIVDQNRPPLRLPDDLPSANLRLLRLSRPSLTRARNAGMRAARWDRVLFMDDDVQPRPDLLVRLDEAARRHSGCILTGMVEQEDKAPDLEGVGFVDLGSGEIRTDYTRPLRGEIPFFPGALFLLRKSDLPPGMEFCPGFRGASQGEEIDFALRARRAGIRCVTEPEIGLYHLKSPAGGCRSQPFRRRFFLDETHNRGLFYGRHGNWGRGAAFLRRMRGFCEFHTRKQDGHDPILLLRAAAALAGGLALGAWLRLRDGLAIRRPRKPAPVPANTEPRPSAA